jgi:hypothetical protein
MSVTAAPKSGMLGSVELSWSPPSSDGGAPIDHYQVSVTNDDGANWTILASPTGPPTVEACGFAGTTCRYGVSAHNVAGYGPPAQSNDVFMSLRSPFMVCGYDPHRPDGFASGYSYNLLTYDPTKHASQQYAADPAATGKFYYLQGTNVPRCGAPTLSFTGKSDDALIRSLPSWIAPGLGNGFGQSTDYAVPGLQMCNPAATTFNGCGMVIPITTEWNQQVGSAAQFRAVTVSIWQVWGDGSGTYNFASATPSNPAPGMSCVNPIRLNSGGMRYCGLFRGTSSMITS